MKDTRYLDAVIAKMHARFTTEELSYLSRHLGEPYYQDGDTKLGLRTLADAQRVADGDLVAKLAAPRYPQTAATRECASCMKIIPRTQGRDCKGLFLCLPCEAQQRQVA